MSVEGCRGPWRGVEVCTRWIVGLSSYCHSALASHQAGTTEPHRCIVIRRLMGKPNKPSVPCLGKDASLMRVHWSSGGMLRSVAVIESHSAILHTSPHLSTTLQPLPCTAFLSLMQLCGQRTFCIFVALLVSSAPVHCAVGQWGSWSTCTQTCDGGMQTRTREITVAAANGGTACPQTEDTQTCNTEACGMRPLQRLTGRRIQGS